MEIYLVFKLLVTIAVAISLCIFCGRRFGAILLEACTESTARALNDLFRLLIVAIAFVITVANTSPKLCAPQMEWNCTRLPSDPFEYFEVALFTTSFILIGEICLIGLMLIVLSGTYNRKLMRANQTMNSINTNT